MSNTADNNGNNSFDDEDLSSLYRRASTEEPSRAVDQDILAKARNNIKSTENKTRYYPGWTQSLSVAAVLVLSVTVILLIEKQQPVYQEEPLPAGVIDQGQKRPHMPAEKIIAKSPQRLEEIRQIKGDTSIDEFSTIQLHDKEMTARGNLAQSPSKAKARKKSETPVMESDAMEAETDVTQFARSLQAPQLLGMTTETLAEEISEIRSCQQLAETECLNSAACTLIKNNEGQGYQCLPAKDHCELMFRQSEGTRESCESRQDCVFIPARCYCPPGVECICGGGDPAQCKNKNK